MQTIKDYPVTAPFWSEADIALRDHFIRSISVTVINALTKINRAWVFERVDAPVLMPSRDVHYDTKDVYIIGDLALRPETTHGSYLIADRLIRSGVKPPLCVWQSGKSFRRESNDGARLSTMRLNEFYQLEFQCVYSKDTKADYRRAVTSSLCDLLPDAELVVSDRLPEYSTKTMDLMLSRAGKLIEVASISDRVDFDGFDCLEIAFGLDRLVMCNGF